MIEQITEKYPTCVEALPKKDRSDYGKVMRTLSPTQRERYLVPLLQEAKINWGQIALASLFYHEKIKSVLTFNFDLILEKASNLLGMQIPVYDFGFSPTDKVGRLAEPSIVHLHGQSYGLVLLNTPEETENHKKSIRPILKDTVQNHLTVVFGYSGEADSAFETLTEEYNSENRLLWLGHNENPPKHLKTLLEKDYAEYFGGLDFDYTMIELAKRLAAWPAPLFKNPMAHLIDELEDVTEYPVTGKDGHYDVLSPLRESLALLSEDWDKDTDCTNETLSYLSGKPAPKKRLQELEKNKAFLSPQAKKNMYWYHVGQSAEIDGDGNYQASLEACKTALLFFEKGEVALYNWGTALGKLERYEDAIEKYAEAVEIKPDNHEALNNWGNALDKLERYEDAIEKYAEAVEIKPDKHEALNNWGNALGKLERYEDAIEILLQGRELSGAGSYNLACVYSLTEQVDLAMKEVKACKKDGSLPDFEHLTNDEDLDSLRERKDFKDLLKAVKQSENSP